MAFLMNFLKQRNVDSALPSALAMLSRGPSLAVLLIAGTLVAAAPDSLSAQPGGRRRTGVSRPTALRTAQASRTKDGGAAFFRNGTVPRLKIQIPPAEWQRLQQQNREYVRCTVI